MLVYKATKKEFSEDVLNGRIAEKIRAELKKHNYNHNSDSEFKSWENSLPRMDLVLQDQSIADDVNIAIEYQIPNTSKRVDFLIGGKNAVDNENVVVIELKQWTEAKATNKDCVVETFVGGAHRNVAHPSYQAYSYARTIENFNANVQDYNIKFHPCAYLHNFNEDSKDELCNEKYGEIIKESPLFLKHDALKLRDFIKGKVTKSSKDIFEKIENGKIRASKSLQDALLSMMHNNEEFIMLDEQKVSYEIIIEKLQNALKEDKKYTIIVEGGPGTGKSVIAINLLATLRKYRVAYVSKNAAPRNVYLNKLTGSDFKKSYLYNLFKGSGCFVEAKENEFDCLIVDEAHRLNEKSGLFANMGENQIKEIINAAKVSVFFIDEKQKVTAKDIGKVEDIKKWAKVCGSEVYYGDDTKLTSQFRCNGSDVYLDFVNQIVGGSKKLEHTDKFDYDFKVFDNPCEMREAVREKNINNKARMLAGYCYEWVSQKNPKLNDIVLENGFQATWNYKNTNTWAIDKESFEQVGCIHTSQGLEFEYVGVIIGKDLRYEDGRVVADGKCRAKSDASLYGLKNDLVAQDEIIRNTYRTLLTRGQYGCYVYCEDKALAKHIKELLNNYTN